MNALKLVVTEKECYISALEQSVSMKEGEVIDWKAKESRAVTALESLKVYLLVLLNLSVV